MDRIFEIYNELNDALKVSVKIDNSEVTRIVVEDLIHKRNSQSNQIKDKFDAVLLYYLTPDEFESFVIKGNPIT